MAGWGIRSRGEAEEAGVMWPPNGEASYSDYFTWEDIHDEYAERIEKDQGFQDIWDLVNTAWRVHSQGRAAYLLYMSGRLTEIRRVLKPSGSVYLHCDPHASHYLKLLMDAVFGRRGFQNEIVWSYSKWTNTAGYFQRSNDIILFYGGEGKTFNKQYVMTDHKRKVYERGWDTNTIKGVRQLLVYDWGKAAAEAQKPKYHRVVDRSAGPPGTAAPQVWTDINYLSSASKERTGCPTQKPVALAARIIEASSNPGDVVLDPFAGCAYVPIAAEGLGRQWIACDISVRAATVVRRQFNKFRYSVDGAAPVVRKKGAAQAALPADADVTIKGPDGLPVRVDAAEEDAAEPLVLPPTEKTVRLFTEQEMKERLLQASGWMCWGCGFAVVRRSETKDRKNGWGWEVVPTAAGFHLDHIDPKPEGGGGDLNNRAPLCPPCNGRKGSRPITLRQLRREVVEAGELRVGKEHHLPDLQKMRNAADRLTASRMAEKGLV